MFFLFQGRHFVSQQTNHVQYFLREVSCFFRAHLISVLDSAVLDGTPLLFVRQVSLSFSVLFHALLCLSPPLFTAKISGNEGLTVFLQRYVEEIPSPSEGSSQFNYISNFFGRSLLFANN